MMSLPPTWRLARLIALDEDVAPAEFVIKPDLCTIGRSPTCQIVIHLLTP